MTSYMNPSKKVTELLSQFLEFDPEQLQLGIWSGNLSLNNVNLRQEAIYPLLNRHLKKNVSTATSESDNGYPEQKCLKPPLKFKLVSGKIGSLTMKIPWKRLVWGQGDVQVDLRNIVIVLALESHEDIEYRAPNTENRETRRSDYAEENDSDSCKQRNQDYTSRSNFPFSRVKKQQVLQEAEKRQLRGRPIGPWLTAITKKEEESRAKKRTAIGDTTTLELRAGRLEKWLRSTTSDFFWRFYVGLQMNVENVKIVLVQDDIELGIIMPSSKVLAGKPVNRRESGNGSIPLSCNEFELEQESNGENTSAVTPPQRAVSDEVCDVGGFIDKQLRQLGIGVYVRKLNQVDKSLSSEFVPLDVYTSDYILRPVDVDLNFSLFFPLPPEKAKQNLKGRTSIGNRQVGVVVDEMSTEGGGSDASSKRRRGKRDKLPPQSKDILTASTEPIKSIVSASQMGRLSSGSNPSVPANFGTFPPQLVRRLSSRGSKMPLLQQEHRRRHSMISDSVHPLGLLTSASRHPRQVSTAATLPLAQPDDFGAVYASNGRGEVSGRTVRFDGKLSVGAVQVICSTRHYYVISAFLAASAKMRNGRPRQTIRSVLDRENDIQRPFTDETDSSFQGHSTEFDCTRKECARVVRSWWQYIFGVIFWELRQRKRLRKIFQQKYLLFSWQQLSYKRCEYINLYIGCRLRKSDSALEEQLLAIEDELPVEQILLYRSIARTVHVRGGTEMPNSIIELNKELKGSPEHFERDNAQNSHDSAIQTSSKDDDRDNDVQFSDNVPNFLSILEARCEVARARRNTDEGSPLPAYHHFEKRSKVFEQGAFSGDEISFGFESKTIKTNQSNKTRSSAAVTMMKAANTVETAAGMVFAFSAHVKKLELLIVEEEKVPYGQCDTNSSSSVSVHSDHSTSSIHLSDVSVLTDDERFLQEEGGLLTSAVDETEATDLVYPSTDYLLFRMPEKVLFQLVITPLSCAMAGRNGVSRCFDCRIGQVKATGVDGCHFITIGAAPLAVAPVHEILVSTEASAGLQELRPRTEAPRDALFLSLAEKNDQRFLQCDTATVRLWVDPPTIFKLASFTSPSSALFPQPLLPISPREDVRLFLQQHEIPASALNCSIRMHGCHITFPLKLDHARTGNDLSFSLDSSSRGDLVDGPVVFRCTMWELYSGSAVEDLCASMEDLQSEGEVFTPLGSLQDGRRKSVKTRQLSMLEAPKLLLTSRSLLASHWLITINGLDVDLTRMSATRQGLFKDPINFEILYTRNPDSLLDFNHAKQEIVVEVSSIHVLVSEERLRNIVLISPVWFLYSSSPSFGDREQQVPPRLEVLSSFMRTSVDISTGRIIFSFLAKAAEEKGVASMVSKKVLLEESMVAFLNFVSRFDLSFPHEDALSAAMQICIDRLAGEGLPLEHCWEATNSVLLNFLEDIAEARREEVGAGSHASGRNGSVNKDQQILRLAIRKSARRTVAMYIHNLEMDDSGVPLDDDVVIDFPDGVSLTSTAFFYDNHISLGIPTLFIATGDGVHLLRVTPPESASYEVSQAESEGGDSEKVENGLRSVFHRHPVQFGVTAQRFALDKDHRLGKGGLPLAILGTDVNADEAERRTREHLDDLEFGDVELLFARPVFHKVVTSLVQIFSPLDRFYEAVPNREGGRPSSKAIGSSLLATAASTSVLFLSDELGPFTRLVATELIGRRKRLVCRSGAEERTEQSISSSVRSLVILNLTPEGELFPTVISVLPSRVGSCLFANYEPNAEVKLAMHGLRIVLLRQFLNEILQYFVSGQYGFGRFFQHLKNQRSSHPNGRSFLRYQISLHDSSLILPRSSSSYEMVCVEVDETTIISSKPKESFVMPTDCTPLVVKDGDHVVRDCDNFDEVSSIFRKKVSIQGFRIFASLQGQDFKTGDMYDSPSFRFFFAIDGRAKAGKQVYCPIAAPDNIVEGYDISANSERAQRVWREITTRNSSLDIVIDNAPHLRILFCDPIDNSSKTEIELDLRLSHFCLLMSIWYSNMQELPLTFPFSALQLQRGSRPLHNATNYPDYGSEAFRSFLKAAVNLTIEVAVVLKKLSLRCTFDRDYAKGEGESAGVCGLCIGFHDAVIHTTKDCRGVFRLGSGSLSAFLVDESRSLSSVLSFGDITTRSNSWADLCFGIDRNRQQLSQELPQRFQLSVFMTPGWPTVYNLGMDIPLLTLSDFSPVFKFLEFFSSYFSDSKFGNLSFEAAERVKNIKEELRRMQTVDFLYVEKISKKGSSIDFRLWLTQPTLAIPCHPLERNGPGVRIKAGGGIWYKYSAIDSLSSHECVSDGLQLIFDDVCTSWKYGDGDNEGAGRYLIENLCLGFRLDTNSASNHKDLCLRLPFTDFAACEFTSQRISASPAVLAPPIICVPFKQPSRYLGPTVCEVTCIIEHLPSTWTALHNLFAGSSADLHVYGDLESATHDEEVSLSDEYGEKRQASCVLRDDDCATPESASIDKEDGTFSLVALVGDVRLFVLDPVLGPHLPVAVMSISSLSVTASQFAASLTVVDECIRGNAPPEDLQVSAAGHFWADYFKLGLTRSWEPLIESYRFNAIYEKSRFRGSGLLFNSDSCLQLIVSSALLVIFEEVFDGFSRLIRETFELDTSSTGVKEDTQLTQASDRLLLADSFLGSDIIHEMPLLLNKENRVAFSLRNITGQRIRILRPFGQLRMPTKLASLSYLDHAETTKLSFSPSISMVKNLQVTEVAYPGLPSSSLQNYKNVSSHTVDMQLQGFRWLEGIAVDTFGRSFANIIPRDPDVNAKIRNDWRLENVMKLLVEVGLKSGGRQVTIRSVFSLTNKTIHNVSLLIHPDPSFKCHDDHINAIGGNQVDQQTVYPSSMKKKSEIAPGESFQVPLLLLECALRQPGSHLGSIWIKPCLDSLDTKAFQSFHAENSGSDSDLHVGFSSKAIQLAKIIYESTMMFKSARGLDLASEDVKSGVQVSCPVIQHTGDRLAPFCYAVEIGRSPLVQARADADTDRSKKPDGEHRPVAYSLSIHPPFVIANLLPEKGRFELMHAVHRTVLWFGDLEAGQQVSVHSVGLDLPLLLFMNIGFAKTPVGEGALVHHGTDPPPGVRDTLVGLKSIGKAGKAVTKQLGKTLTSIAESPDQRGHQKLFLAQNPQLQSLKQKEGKRIKKAGAKSDLGLDTDLTGIDEVDGKTYTIDAFHFFPDDVVHQTTVVDGLGQRLQLDIENVRGGGGQRRISVFCRYWILNTTEHCLRYKQENSKFFVSGTVLSPNMNGSLPLSGGRSRAKYRTPKSEELGATVSLQPLDSGTIFPGTPGALATKSGQCELSSDLVAPLLDNNMPLERIAQLAFMFNFHEGPVMAIGRQQLCVQLGDGTGETQYESDWSRGFSLDSVGISQIIAMHCKDGRALELSVVVTVAPDFLSSYTKIVRFLPRYVIVNCLPYPVRIWQDNSIFQPLLADHTGTQDKITKWRYSKGEGKRSPSKINQYEALWGRETRLDEREVGRMPNGTAAHGSELYITTVFPAEFIPFSLPDSRDERQLRVDLGNPWSLTASISADIPGDHALKIKRAVDLRVLPHVSTRSNPQYEVRLPPSGGNIFDGELGVWFETEWGTSRNLIVKAVRKYSYAFNETDVHVGDELLAIDGIPVSQMTFVEAMGMLRSRLSEVSSKNVNEISRKRVPMQSRRSVANNRPGQEVFPGEPVIFENKPFVLTFRTLEERRRKVRLKAANAGGERPQTKFNAMIDQENSPYSVLSASDEAKKSNIYIQAELKTLSRSSVGMFLVLRDKADAPFEIHNQAITSTIYYRQRGCNHHVWQSLKPGQSNSYSWDEPLKPKRLMVRVASDWTFDFGDDELRHALPDNIAWSSKFAEADRSSRRRPFRLFKEEDAVFSPSISIRLEEIGYEEFLPIQSLGARKDNKSPVKYLKFEGDVEGGARVLVVKDVSGEQGEHQMTRHLVSLQQKIDDEEKNVKELRSLNVFLAASVEHKLNDEDHRQAEEMTRKLMVNFSEEATITGRHQIIVEVLEAIGLNPESFVGSCNPYAEVWLKSGSPGRTTLFRKKDLRRTYFVRKSLNPTWNAQSFVFAVPCGAESVTRGHSIQVRVRNFCVLGNHQTLGRAQVDLHSVRDQDPLMGWFPLAGRTGRRELENRKSHWGRGSVKLKVQWIYTTPALVQYSLHLSERRLLELQESVVGLTQQLAKKKELEKKKKAGIDGFKAVRVKELSSFSKTNTNLIAAQIRKLKMLSNSGVKRIIEPQPPSEKSGLHASFEEETDGTDIVFFASPVGAEGIRTRLNSSNDVVKKFEDRIYLQRLNFQRLASSRFRVNNKPSTHGDGVFLVSSFKFWASVQAVLSESDFETEFRGDEIKILLRRASPTIHEKEFDMHPDCQNTVEQKLAVPANAPALVRAASESYVAEFFRSRGSVERTARISLKTILHPGGWLSIRPITALNLPDVYTGMFVKVRYGPDTILSETADAKALDPTWCKPDSRAEPEEQLDIMSRNDLHIRITPQKTSGIIRLSIIGERSQQHLHAKTELGVLHLPLGATISACTYRSESCLDCGTDGSSPMLVRWFPLTSPKDAAQEEGDERLNTRPSDSENTSDSLFHEYFAPCIQLALLWTPDLEEKCDDENHESLHSHTVIGRSHSAMGEVATSRVMVSPLLKSYFNAEIGRISVSLIDSQNVCELLSFSAHDIDVRYWVTNAKTRIGVTIGWLQLDYQDDNVREPVVLAPTPSDVLGPVLQTLAVKDNIRSVADILSFDFIDFSIAEFDLTIEERLLSDLFSFFTSVRHKKEVELRARGGWESYEANNAIYEHRSLMKSTSPIDDRSLHSLLATEVCEESSKQSKLYIRQLVLGVVKVNLSYLKGKKSLWEGQRLGRWVDKRFDQVLGVAGAEYMTDNFSASENSDLFLAWSQHTSEDERHSEDDGTGYQNLQALLATLFPNVSDAPIRLPSKSLDHLFESPSEILPNIRKFYVNETLKQIYKIVGSLDFVGNPTMLVSSFFSGVRDLVVAPSVAFMQSPTDPSRVGLGVAQGTLSLVSHSTSGFFGVLAKLSAAAGQSVATLSLDEDFRDWHRDKVVVETANLNREWKRRGVQSVGLMLTRPVIDILLGITGGISGIIISPVKGYQRNGKVGLAMGIAVGGVGLIAKPSVGVLDAFTHFTASIHDIAKSVNLLDRRLQPALRLRLPYTFGMMSILAPFDAAAARAADLLKRFPIKDSRRTSVAKSEKMIHVEVLPSTGTKTFAIATSARVVLIRVEKEQSGSLTTSLRWEVPFSYDAAISSRVDDHGHNGVALTLLKRVNGDIGGSDRNKSNDPLVSSPQLIGRSSDTLQSVRFITPEERMSSGTKSEEFGHGTGRGTEGDLLEWFTILAEYQYRRQLTRLHNVISCITKDFSAIVRDSSIGRASSTEGYTSFGMFFFERDSNTDAEKKFTQPINRFENLPWVGKDAFDVARGKSLSEQKLFLSTLRGEWDFNSELESSRREGGPMWLIKARARAAFVDNFTLTSSSSLRDEEEKLALPNFSKVTTNEDTTAKQTLSMIPNEKADINAPEISLRLSKFKSARLFEPDGDDADSQLSWPEVDSRGKIDLRTKVSPVICQNSVQLDTDGRQTPKKAIQSRVAAHLKVGSMSESSDQSIHSFRSAGTGPHVRSPNKIISVSHSMSSLDEGFNVTHGTDHSESLASLSIFKEGEDQQMANAERASARDDRSKRQRRRLREDRMDRMEALLERLLIFSSEQALQNQARFVENCDSSRLYQEISELRAAIEQTESARVSPQDINTLREDVASLREQLGLPPASAVHKATHPS